MKVLTNKNGKKIYLLNPDEKARKYLAELKVGSKLTNMIEPKLINGKLIRLSKEDKAYRVGYLNVRKDNSKAYMSKLRKKISRIYMSRFRHEEDFGFHRLTISELPKLTGEDGGKSTHASVLQARVEAYKAAYEKFDDALKVKAKVSAAKLVSQADKRRDEAFRKLRNYAKLMAGHPNPELAAIAQEVIHILKNYDDPTTLPQNEESGTLHNIMQDIEALGSEKREKIGIDSWSGHLKAAMDAYDAAVAQRAKEESGREEGVVKRTRREADEAYRSLVRAVNSLAEIEGDTEYAAFIDAMNSHIEHQKTTLKARANNKKGA